MVHVVRPFSSHRATEIVAAPKVYGFDTGFVCYHRGWHDLRREDLGFLWEHYVLNEMYAHLQKRGVHYWRDKRGHEIDFVIAERGKPPTAVECKWSSTDLDDRGFQSFRNAYPKGENWVVAQDVDRTFTRKYGRLTVKFMRLSELIREMTGKRQ